MNTERNLADLDHQQVASKNKIPEINITLSMTSCDPKDINNKF